MTERNIVIRQLVLSDLSFREQAAESALLSPSSLRRKQLDGQMAKDKSTLRGWIANLAITDAEIASCVLEVTSELLEQCSLEELANAELELVELKGMADRLSLIAGPDEIDAAKSEIDALQADHAARRATLLARVAKIQSIRVGGLQWRR